VARWAPSASIASSRKHLRAQFVRAADSIVLNLAEGSGHPPGDARRNHYRIALGSAAEVHAVMDLIGVGAEDAHRLELERVGAMLTKLVRR
jgi:four helix bundle protein